MLGRIPGYAAHIVLMNIDYSTPTHAPLSYPLPVIAEMAARDKEVFELIENGAATALVDSATARSQADVKRLVDAVAAIGILASAEETLRSDFIMDLLAEALGQQ